MDGPDQTPQGWDDLDQSSVRKSLRDIIHEFPETIDDRLVAMKQLMEIVREVVSRDLSQHLNPYITQHAKDRPADARRLVQEIDGWLAGLGLAVKDPGSGLPSRLALAPTPPASGHDSWLQLEVLANSGIAKPTRLKSPLPWLELIAEPTRAAGKHRIHG